MNPNQSAAYKNLELAQQALKSGDKNTATRLATQAAELAPELEEVWLLMAALASPRESVDHLQKALQINPNSERARKGMTWALGRMKQDRETETPSAVSKSVEPIIEQQPEETHAAQPAQPAQPQITWQISPVLQPESNVQEEPEATYQEEIEELETQTAPADIPTAKNKNAFARSKSSFIPLLVVLLCLVIAWAGWRSVTPVAAFLSDKLLSSPNRGPAWAEVNIAKPDNLLAEPLLPVAPLPTAVPLEATLPPSSGLATLTPTEAAIETTLPSLTPLPPTEVPPSSTPEPTNTMPVATATPLPTDTALVPVTFVPTVQPTNIPEATPTALPTDSIAPTSTPDLFTQATPTPLPTDTALPGPTLYIPPTPRPGTGGGAGHWLDVDLTNQMLYAYDGNTLVSSFVVSTGTWEHPTVTGQYRVYVKYKYTDMSGPGYYLPNVPYTMYFYQGYAVHGTYWHNNFGTPMSHGCVNLSIPDSEWVYNFSTVGTLVNVHY
jgi:lipoprotein-anchoring transpeptidase ErfK/SrfK